MAVDPTLPLQHQIDRRRVSDQYIKVDVQALLSHLRGDEDMTTPGPALWPEERKDILLDLQPLTHRKPCMEQNCPSSSQTAKEGLGPRHLVHHHQHPRTLTGPASRLNRQGIEIGWDRPHLHLLLATGGKADRLLLACYSPADPGIGSSWGLCGR